jgi:hypothetical protein
VWPNSGRLALPHPEMPPSTNACAEPGHPPQSGPLSGRLPALPLAAGGAELITDNDMLDPETCPQRVCVHRPGRGHALQRANLPHRTPGCLPVKDEERRKIIRPLEAGETLSPGRLCLLFPARNTRGTCSPSSGRGRVAHPFSGVAQARGSGLPPVCRKPDLFYEARRRREAPPGA